jgi:hypothetical protein
LHVERKRRAWRGGVVSHSAGVPDSGASGANHTGETAMAPGRQLHHGVGRQKGRVRLAW